MSDIEIPFNEWSRDKLAKEQKTATTRTSRYGDPGDTFTVNNIEYELTHTVYLPLKVVTKHFYAEEGCNFQAEFKEVWKDIHPNKGYEPAWMVWLHLFRKL